MRAADVRRSGGFSVAWVAALLLIGCGGGEQTPEPSSSEETETVAPGVPALFVDPAALAFGDVDLGESAERTLTLKSIGTAPLIVSDASTLTPFSVSGPSWPVTLFPDDTITLSVRFAPEEVGEASGALTLVTDDPDSPRYEVSLSGEGIGLDDLDGDGFDTSEDCDDGDEDVFPGADDDTCDGIDQDCDRDVDEDVPDTDDDGLSECDDPCPADPDNDGDGDDVCGDEDVCPLVPDAQGDLDGDGDGDACDVCPADRTNDSDKDGLCDSEDPCPTIGGGNQDSDGDGAFDCQDPCPEDPQDDRDGDGLCDSEDACPEVAGGNQDSDGDGIFDCEDLCPRDEDNDQDQDGVCGDVDVCPTIKDDQADEDQDGVGDACEGCTLGSGPDPDRDTLCGEADLCPEDPDGGRDTDQDGLGDACDACPDDAGNDPDQDGICAADDLCPDKADDGADLDGDGIGDACDACPADPANDSDDDGVCGDVDACPLVADDQKDTDGDGIGDACEGCTRGEGADPDADQLCGEADLCPTVPDTGTDRDDDGAGDACDPCPLDPLDDVDGDGTCGDVDPCPSSGEDGDADGDGTADGCDLCPDDEANDIDEDGVCGDLDVCPDVADPEQQDSDGDGDGDACDVCPDDEDDLLDDDGACLDLPPDPREAAPALDRTVGTTLYASGSFLFEQDPPVQREASPESIDPVRAAILRGVVQSGGEPLPGVRVSIRDHEEYGYTLTRKDGAWDLMVNGGGPLQVDFERKIYLPVQREVDVPWQRWVHVETVEMTRQDSRVTTLDLSGDTTDAQVHRGSTVTDDAGTRTNTLIVPSGTRAIVRGEDGSTTEPETLDIRATEYTVGERGPKAMPGDLPHESGYTYAVELSADEAPPSSDAQVEFDRPVINYVENFLDFPVGSPVPVGYFDRRACGWVPSDNGRVIAVTALNSGVADLDIDGDGEAEADAALQDIGITLEERRALGGLYASGQSLWRVVMTHFTPWDYNWPWGPPGDSRPPGNPAPQIDPIEFEVCEGDGPIRDAVNRDLQIELPLPGAGFELRYNSRRMPGRTDCRFLDIALSGSEVPESVKRIELTLEISGQKITRSYEPSSDERYEFLWDGLDGYGRKVQGAQPVSVRVGWVYDAVYQAPGEFQQSFGRLSGVPLEGNRARREITLYDEFTETLGCWDAPALGLGGFDLSIRHAYDTQGRVLHQGDGRSRQARAVGNTVRTLASRYRNQEEARAYIDGSPVDVAVDALGRIYIVMDNAGCVQRLDRDGSLSTVMGVCDSGYGYPYGERAARRPGERSPLESGTPVDLSYLYYPSSAAVDCEGNLFVADSGNYRILKLTSDGQLELYAGNGSYGYSGDGGAAVDASFTDIGGIAADDECNLYVADVSNHRIRRIDALGVITTWAGTGEATFAGDGGPALGAAFNYPSDLALGPDGSLYVADSSNLRVRRIRPDGIIETVVGTGTYGYLGEGLLGEEAQIEYPYGLAVDRQGRLYISEGVYIDRLEADGRLYTFAGNRTNPFGGIEEGEPAILASFYYPTGMAMDQVGGLIVADSYNARVRRVSPALPGFDAGEFGIPSEDGQRYFVFDAEGRHLRTVDSLYGHTVHTFDYDDAGRLVQVTEPGGEVTTFQRGESGAISGITTSQGQVLSFTLGEDGQVETAADPSGGSVSFEYTGGGLLSSLESTSAGGWSFTWDARGRLSTVVEPGAGTTSLSYQAAEDGYELVMTSAGGRAQHFQRSPAEDGSSMRTWTSPSGVRVYSFEIEEDKHLTEWSDGAGLYWELRPDPRFGALVPYRSYVSYTEYGEMLASAGRDRYTYLADPDDPTSVGYLSDYLYYDYRWGVGLDWSIYDRLAYMYTSEYRDGVASLDESGALSSYAMAELSTIQATYDGAGRLIGLAQGEGTSARTLSWTYDGRGNVSSSTDAEGNTVNFTWTQDGQVSTSADDSGASISFSWTGQGRPSAITTPTGNRWSFAYNQAGRLTTFTPPALGSAAVATTFQYDADQLLEKITLPQGESLTLSRDPSTGRLTRWSTPSGQVSLNYDGESGRLESMATSQGDGLEFTYDGASPSSQRWTGQISGAVEQTLAPTLLSMVESVKGDAVSYDLDMDGLIIQAGDATISRGSAGLVEQVAAGGVSWVASYNTFGELESAAALDSSGAAKWSLTYTRDRLGRIVQIDEILPGDSSRVTTYGYDAAGRLTSVGDSSAPRITYTYDGNGNRTAETYSTGSPLASTFNAQDRHLSWGNISYSWRGDGALGTRKVGAASPSTYTFDLMGRLTRVVLADGRTIDYVLDPLGRRIGKKINGALVRGWLYDRHSRIIAELSPTGAVLARYVYGSRQQTPDLYYDNDGVAHVLFSDHLGSVRYVLNTETLTEDLARDYDVWGAVTQEVGESEVSLGFAGGLYDEDTRLYLFGTRSYDPEVGRWSTRSPLGFAGGDTNLYAYAFNDPINLLPGPGGRVERASSLSWGLGFRAEGEAGVGECGRSAADRTTLGDLPTALGLTDPALLQALMLDFSPGVRPMTRSQGPVCASPRERMSWLSEDVCGRRDLLPGEGPSLAVGECIGAPGRLRELIPEIFIHQRLWERYDTLTSLLNEAPQRRLAP